VRPARPRSSEAPTVAERVPDPEPVTATFPAVTAAPTGSGPSYSENSSSPVFPEQPPGTGSFPEQAGGRRRIPRPITPLRERERDLSAHKIDPRLADRTDGPAGR
jgi:hypothetical protein